MTTFNEQMKRMLNMMEKHSNKAKIEEQQVNSIINSERRKELYKINKEKILQKKKEKYQNKKESLIYKNIPTVKNYSWLKKN